MDFTPHNDVISGSHVEGHHHRTLECNNNCMHNIVGVLHTPKLLCISLDSIFIAGQATRLLTESKSFRGPDLWKALPSESPPPSPWLGGLI